MTKLKNGLDLYNDSGKTSLTLHTSTAKRVPMSKAVGSIYNTILATFQYVTGINLK